MGDSARSCRNVLILLADSFRYDCIGGRVKTPVLDAFAAESTRFTNAYTPLPVCAPARQALLTGLHPDAIGAMWNYDFYMTKTIAPKDAWSTDLKKSGYHTGYVGKWHASSTFSARDFGYDDVIDYAAHNKFLRETYPNPGGGWLGCESPIPVAESITHFAADSAISLLNKYTASDAPFHLWVDFGVPHLPCRPSAPFSRMYDAADIPPWPGFYDEFTNKPYCHKQQTLNWHLENAAWDEVSPMVARYFAMISQLDNAIGRILAALKIGGAYDNTLVIFTADHGDMCANHRMLDKHYVMYEDITRVPLIIKQPEQQPRTVSDFVSNCLDLPMIIRNFAGLEPKPDHGMAIGSRECATSSSNGQQFGLFQTRMIRDARHKYVWNLTDIDELYDLELDPGEMNNLLREQKHTARITHMRRLLFDDLAAHNDPIVGGGWVDEQLLNNRKI